MAEQKYTPVGHELWRWFSMPRWQPLTSDDRLLWIFFYTSRLAKTSVPGLWPGDIWAMASSGLSPNEAHNAVDRLVEHGFVQWDQVNQLVRLTELPDFLDRAHTAQAIWGWWGRFKTLPNVPLRNAHITLLWDMIKSGKVNDKMVEAWKQTFGTVSLPSNLPRFLPPSSSDTSTVVQPSLFSAPDPTSNENNNSGPRGHGSPLDRDLRSGSEIGLVGEEGDPDPPHLRLVPSPTEDEIARAERESYARDMEQAIVAAGGGDLLRKPNV